MKKVSVIMTTYNRPHLVGKAIDSVLGQTFQDFDYFIMDDNSDSLEHKNKLFEYWNAPNVIIYKSNVFHPERKEISRWTRQINTAVNISNSAYHTYLSDDDYYAQDRLERMVGFLDAHHDAMIVIGDQIGNRLNPDGSEVFDSPIRKQPGVQTNPNCNVDYSSFMHRAEVFEKVRWNESRTSFAQADGEFLMDCGKYGWYGRGLGGHPTDTHVKHDGSWNQLKVWNELEEKIKLAKTYKRKVSVLLTTYNRPEMLEIAIKSVLKQTYEDFELIILDDNSDDPRQLEVLKWAWDQPRVSILKWNTTNAQRGETVRYATMINHGLKLAQGDLITYLCDDDVFEKDRLERMVKWFDENPDKHFLGGNQRLLKKVGDQYFDMPTLVRTQNRVLLKPKMSIDHSSVMHRKECYEKLGGWDDNIKLWGCADGEFFQKLADNGYLLYPLGGHHTDTHVYHDGSWTSNQQWKNLGK